MLKGQAKRIATMQAKGQEKQLLASRDLNIKCAQVLSYMDSLDLRFVDIISFVFNPKCNQGHYRWHEFLAIPGAGEQVLNWWASTSARDQLEDWALQWVVKEVKSEARAITKSKVLQTMHRPMTAELISSFDLPSYHDELADDLAPTAMSVIEAFATSPHAPKHKEKRKKKTALVKTVTALMCLGEYSRSNNLMQKVLSMYLYGAGAHTQTLNVFSHFGLTESYSSLISSRLRRKRRTRKKKSAPAATDTEQPPASPTPASTTGVSEPADSATLTTTASTEAGDAVVDGMEEGKRIGILHQLSESVRAKARQIAKTGVYGIVYDNINFNYANAEQILGRHDTQENGTIATLFTLNGPASRRDLNLKALERSFLEAPPLDLKDILLSEEEQVQMRAHLVATILRVIIDHGGERFKKFKDDMKEYQPRTDLKLRPQKTKLFPLPAWNIDESSTTGNIDVVNAIYDEIETKNDGLAKIIEGDQLTVDRLRGAAALRAGHEKGFESFSFAIPIPGLFHTKMADLHGVLLTHFGKPGAGTANPGSLVFHNTRLDRLPITLTSLPPFRVTRDLIFVSMYARVLHCLLLVSKCGTLDAYLDKYGTWDDLVKHASAIFDQFGTSTVVEELRWERGKEVREKERKHAKDVERAKAAGEKEPRMDETVTKGDMVFENACLFLRDTLISREFTDAIKSNDPGRILLVLKVFALSFRGTGRLKYAYEMLFFLHHIKHVWPAGARRIALNNMVLNPSGEEESGVEGDLVQEQVNLLAKVKYKARGSNASWEWMFMITPCTIALRDLQNHINDSLGSDMGTKHASAKLAQDIKSLMHSLNEHKVYEVVPGRVTPDEPPVPDVINNGLNQLAGPLNDYNTAFKRLQTRRKLTPATQEASPQLTFSELPPAETLSAGAAAPDPPPLSPEDTPPIGLPTSDELLSNIPELNGFHDTTDDVIEEELEHMLEELEQEEEGLPILSMRDIAVNMDAFESDAESELETDSDSDSDYE